MSFVTRRKPVEAAAPSGEGQGLKRSLGWPHLVALGVGAIIGTGIYTLTGVAAGLAGPSVILSFAAAGLVCAGRGALLRRNGQHDAAVGQRLYLRLCEPGRTHRLDRRRQPYPRIHPRLQRRVGGLVGLCHGLAPRRRRGSSATALRRHRRRRQGCRRPCDRNRHCQRSGDLHRARRHRHAAGWHTRERDGELRPRLREAGGARRLRGLHLAALRCGPFPPVRPIRIRRPRDRR